MNITQLTVVNACLASMGEEPINSLADENSFVNSAKFALEQANINEQTRGWYFNLETLTVHPHAVDNRYYLPADVIDFTKDDFNPGWINLRGSKIYDSNNAQYLSGTKPLKVRIVRLLTFEDLPIMARRMVKAASVMLFQQSYDGDSTKIQEAQTEYQLAYSALNTQHIKAVGANFLPRRGTELRQSSRRLRV